MSAYAAAFFFPSLKEKSNHPQQKITPNDASTSRTLSSAASTSTSTSTPSNNKALTSTSTSTSTPTPLSSSTKNESSWYNKNDGLLISIKSASIDPIRLIQSFTTRSKSPKTKGTSSVGTTIHKKITNLSNSCFHGMNMNDSDDEQWGEYEEEEEGGECEYGYGNGHKHGHGHGVGESDDWAAHWSPTISEEKKDYRDMHVSTRHHNHHYNHHKSPADAACPTEACPGDDTDSRDAIQFCLSITFNGRKYTATRALPTFVKLRQDLMYELSNRGNANKRKLKRPCGIGVTHAHSHTRGHGPAIKTSTQNTYNTSNSLDSQQGRDENSVTIPELPLGGSKRDDLEKGAIAMAGFAGRGFSRMQATVCSYCPPMEEWLKTVASLVPSSPSLADFLWEPVDKESSLSSSCSASDSSSKVNLGPRRMIPKPSSMRRTTNSRVSMSNLNCINESDEEDNDSDDE